MTPLTRWVFLPLLLGTAASLTAQRAQDACVPLCLARSSSIPEIRGVCDYEGLGLQSDAGQSAKERLLRRCLTPCRKPKSQDQPLFFDQSYYCRFVRQSLIRLRACPCDSVEDERTLLFGYWEDSSWMDGLVQHHTKYEPYVRNGGLSNILRSVLEKREEGRDSVSSDLSKKEVRMKVYRAETLLLEEESKKELEEAAGKPLIADRQLVTTKDPDSSEELPIDWEMWCMAQCDNGQGGSACNCDIIP